MTISTNFDDLRFTPSTNLQPIFDMVAAVQNFHGAPPATTDLHYAFPTFYLTQGSFLSTGERNISLELTARSAELECQTIANFTYSVDNGQVKLSAWDRGCQITQDISPSSSPAFYFPTSPTIDCATLASPSRLVLAAGEFDGQSVTLLKHLSLISCLPRYLATEGILKLIPGPANTTISQFSPVSPAQVQYFWPWQGFETALHQVGYYNPQTNVSSTGFGNLILALAQQSRSDAILHPDTLIAAAEKLFTSVFAVLGATVLFSSATTPNFGEGSIDETHTRLFVVIAAAAPMISVLACAVLGTIVICLRSRRVSSVLLEEPASLAGFANLLFGSGLLQLVGEMRDRHDYDGKFVKYFKRNYDGKLSKVRLKGSSPEKLHIVFSPLKHKVRDYDFQIADTSQ
ncbi:hypothetical protein H2200_007401 [Cladophialophora chaetospira]|uniref:Uncharacterized protein n=1 Tax=Cladophialophora chaetospira TaxID=386627 RepID=A0AA39CHM2_9EURO|nr:hypothetical protein H2200_007401 [Cladophialophora chaetospira]